MKRTRIARWLAQPGHTQAGLAELVGASQSGISRMADKGRTVHVVEDGDQIRIEETRVLAAGRRG